MNDDFGHQIGMRMRRSAVSVIAKCFDCKAQHDITVDESGPYVARDVKCLSPLYEHVLILFKQELRLGAYWTCTGCGTRSEIGLAMFAASAAEGKEAAQA